MEGVVTIDEGSILQKQVVIVSFPFASVLTVVDFETVVGNVVLGEVVSSVGVLDDSKITVVDVVLEVCVVESVFEVEVTVEVCPISVIEDAVVVVEGICAVVV